MDIQSGKSQNARLLIYFEILNKNKDREHDFSYLNYSAYTCSTLQRTTVRDTH